MSEAWHRRHAVSLVSQLPEDPNDARAVLREAMNLLDNWMHPATVVQPSANVLALRRERD
jgi:hypothetical protein